MKKPTNRLLIDKPAKGPLAINLDQNVYKHEEPDSFDGSEQNPSPVSSSSSSSSK